MGSRASTGQAVEPHFLFGTTVLREPAHARDVDSGMNAQCGGVSTLAHPALEPEHRGMPIRPLEVIRSCQG